MTRAGTNYDGAVIERDSAFLWETEALRTRGRTRPVPSGQSSQLLAGQDWLTLKEASDVTGVPTNTIRKWARHENIPSYLEKTEEGHLRVVSLDGIRRWAAEIGRELEWSEETDDEDVVVDLTPEPVAEPDPGPEPERPETPIPEGSMLVPLDAWNKMLNQLGNLHEAGQQLAEARERAAKAETEAQFLKERLAEMRSELGRERQAAAPPGGEDGPEEDVQDATTTLGGTAASLARKLYEGLRERWS
jgi:hypothetical protein